MSELLVGTRLSPTARLVMGQVTIRMSASFVLATCDGEVWSLLAGFLNLESLVTRSPLLTDRHFNYVMPFALYFTLDSRSLLVFCKLLQLLRFAQNGLVVVANLLFSKTQWHFI